MAGFMTPTIPGKSKDVATINDLEPFVLPERQKDEEYYCYITAIKHESPFDHQYFDGVDFSKGVLPPEASYVENESKNYEKKLPTKLLTKTQAKAIRERAKARTIHLLARPNVDFDPREKDSKEYLPNEIICVNDFLIFCKAEDFHPQKDHEAFLQNVVKEANAPQDEGEKFSKAIYENQKDPKKKR